jgi:pantoate--beta-alanine ligase
MVKVIKTLPEMLENRKLHKSSVGFVPTMGNLHAGHISLLEEALKHSSVIYFSIFVNPKQFGPNEDFSKYPRTLEKDLSLIQVLADKHPEAEIIVFAPENPAVVYEDHNETIEVMRLNNILEGKVRPYHFEGVATVVLRLFQIVKPEIGFFGLKDYQQYLVIKKMVEDLCLPIKIIGMPIIRDESGLALSSRNQYLTSEEKVQGLTLSKSLRTLKEIISDKKNNLDKAKEKISEFLKDKNWNYLEMRDAETLSTDIEKSKSISILGVYQLRTTRLLDNIQVVFS